MPQANPFLMRDFRQGVYRKSSVNNYLAPLNSVQHSLNINYDTIIGSAVVRPGVTLLGTQVAANYLPQGLAEFVPKPSVATTSRLLVAFDGLANGTIYYWNGTIWAASNIVTLVNGGRVRFAQLGGSSFAVTGNAAMVSSVDGLTWNMGIANNCIATDSVLPSLIYRAKGRLLASGDTTVGSGHSKSRVFFSSIIDPNASPFITWNTNLSTGDFIDINPDDGGDVAGFAETSSTILVFKGNGMYRLNTLTKSTDPQNIFNIGAVSQEGIVNCQGLVYFFSGIDIRRTDGSFPEQISRLGVQDFVDAIPQANWSKVAAGTDGLNVYFSIGNVTLNTAKDTQVTYNNVVLKFSPRDQTWGIHSYGDAYRFFAQYTTTGGRMMYAACDAGDVQSLNNGVQDRAVGVARPIYFELLTQEIDFDNRANNKVISDKMVVFTQYGLDGRIQIQADDNDPSDIKIDTNQRVAVAKDLNIQGNFFTIRWFGIRSTNSSPVLEGFLLTSVTDQGIIR